MPEFKIDLGCDTGRWSRLDAFTQGYVECMFFTNTGIGDVTFADLSQMALATINAECAEFQEANAALLRRAYDKDYDASRAGYDFWLTRNRHGAGFWDRGLGEIGEELSQRARIYGSCDVYLGDDEQIYM